jgi:molybdate transport system substrate-binding protein
MKALLGAIVLEIMLLHAGENSLLFYCGATMVRPMQEIARLYEKRYGIDVKIVQGGSGDLLRQLKTEKNGDLYLPGSVEYLEKKDAKALFGTRAEIGVNSLVLLVRKGNPHGIRRLDDLLRPGLRIAIGASRLGSIGKVTRETLLRKRGREYYCRLQNNAMYFVTDSRELVQMLKRGQIDVGISWKATAFFPENRSYVETVPFPEDYEASRRLQIAVLKWSKHPKTAKKFVDLAASSEGQAIMKENGFR